MLSLPAITRRRWLQIGSVGLAGPCLPRLLQAQEAGLKNTKATAKACILVYLDGGPSHIDLWDLKPVAPAEIRGPFAPIATTVSGLQVCEHLPLMARQMHRMTLIRSVQHKETVHDPAVYQMLTGHKHVSSAGGLEVQETDAPQLGTAFGYCDTLPAVMPKVIQLPETMRMQARILPGQNAGHLGASYDPFRVEMNREAEVLRPALELQAEMSAERFGRWRTLAKQFNQDLGRLQETAETRRFDTYQRQALEILARPSVQQAFDLDLEPTALRDRYGRQRHGQSLLLARRLVEAGTRFVTVYWGNEPQDWADGKGARPANNPWDTHRNHFPLTKDTLLPRADKALAALVEDLDERGLVDETLVVWMGDFGRTPRINRQFASRDHWPHAFSILMAGGGMPRGRVYGRTDRIAAEVVEDPVSPADVTATIFAALGIDPQTKIAGPRGLTESLSQGRSLLDLI